MAKFSFRFQSYLSLKEKLEEQKKLEYGQAIAELEAEKQIKVKLESERKNCLNEFKSKIEDKIDPISFQRYNSYIELLKKRISKQNVVIQKAEKKVEEKRLILIEAMKERKMLETLKEKELVEYIREEQKMENKRVDEIVSYQYNKR